MSDNINLQDRSPLGKSASHTIILSTLIVKSVGTLSCSLFISAFNWYNPRINLDPAVNASAPEDLSELLTILSTVSDCIVKNDDSSDVFLNPLSS